MKTIVLVRHAKSSWDHDVIDLKRPLNKRGHTDAGLVAKAFMDSKFFPDAIYSSPANRALMTCQIFMETLKLSKDLLSIEEQLYDFGGARVLQCIKTLQNDFDNVMIFGHNHAFTALANSLGDKAIDNLPTSGLVLINFNVDNWQSVTRGTTKIILRPKDLK